MFNAFRHLLCSKLCQQVPSRYHVQYALACNSILRILTLHWHGNHSPILFLISMASPVIRILIYPLYFNPGMLLNGKTAEVCDLHFYFLFWISLCHFSFLDIGCTTLLEVFFYQMKHIVMYFRCS